MILPRSRVIDLDQLETAFLSMIELRYLGLDFGESLFDPRYHAALEDAIESFIRHIYDYHDQELVFRDALAWMLNLPTDRFEAVLGQVKVPYPHYRDLGEIRRFLELLWQRTWGDWTVAGFDPDAYE